VTPVVVDTSVAIKAVLEEPDSDRADALFAAAARGSHRLVAPELLVYEFGNVLWKQVRRAVLTEAEANYAIVRFPFDQIDWLPGHSLLPGAFQYAIRYRLTVYDAAFLSAATLLGVELITADRGLHRKVSGNLPWVKLLHELPVPWP
jgi:predicted nucleic acid-binding protein